MNEFKQRLKKLDGLKEKCDAVLLMNFDEPFKDVNYFYFTGNDSTYSAFLYDFSEAKIITNELELPKVKNEAWIKNISVFERRKRISESIIKNIGGAKIIGVNENFSYFLAKKLGRKIVDITEYLENIRAIKSKEEIENISRACGATAKIMENLKNFIKPGMRDSEIRRRIETNIIEKGCEPAFFDTVANSGKNSAIPHSINSGKMARRNEPVIVDFGCRFNGYHSDMTRMFNTENFKGRMKEQYDILLSLMEELKDFIMPGMKASEVDALARRRLKDYEKNFFFATGHGVGLLPHENPRIYEKSKDILKEDMVFTIEPGIYFKNYGLRIEDTVLLTGKGIKVLTKTKY